MRHQCEWVDCFRDGEYVPADHRTGSICGKPAVDIVRMDPGDDPPPEDEDGHKWWLCAEHYDQWTAPRPMGALVALTTIGHAIARSRIFGTSDEGGKKIRRFPAHGDREAVQPVPTMWL